MAGLSLVALTLATIAGLALALVDGFVLALPAHWADAGLVLLDESGIQVTAQGWFFVRAVAMVFDRYLQADRNRARFSRII